ncbi:MAG: 3-phosphoshikimate 1-carboxyvinyltransferase [Clostridia bacterium]|nr:3-phosphoshikimate 1-carboxyvinyltransferase [Clostridia bacterium]
MNVTITPTKLCGTVKIPPSKSYSHRALIAAYLGAGSAESVGESEDIRATKRCLDALSNAAPMDANESGSTLRFMLPIALAVNGGAEITGTQKLLSRPLDEYERIFSTLGITFSNDGERVRAKGKLKNGVFHLNGNVSSQFITGLLFALPLLEGDSEIIVAGDFESIAYVDMTLHIQREAGVDIKRDGTRFYIKGGQSYRKADIKVEGDCSQSAFFLAMETVCTNLPHHTLQGDCKIIDIYRAMGMKINEIPGGFASNGIATRPIEVDIAQTPDLAPPLAAVMAVTEGTSRITNATRLRLKESDRIQSIQKSLSAIGAEIFEEGDTLLIKGRLSLCGGVADSYNDHRIAMALAVASQHCVKPLTILGAHCVNKSMPNFWDVFRMLGGKFETD